MPSLKVDSSEIQKVLKNQKYKIRSATNTKIVVEVNANRFDTIDHLSKILKNLGAKYEKNMPGSSIGGVKIGNVSILVKSLGKSGGLDVEAAAIKTLQESIMTAMQASGGPITIKVNTKTIKDCVGVEKTTGTPKSDFHVINSKGDPVIFISHKKGSKPNDFQQWAGMTETRILNHPEVQNFIAECKSIFGDKMPTATSVYKKIKDKDLKMMSVFGVDYDKSSGINNVDVLIQGDPGLKQKSSYWELTASGHLHYNGDIPDQGFEPVLSMIYKGDRDQFGIKGARASVYPIQGRKLDPIEEYSKKVK